MVDNELIDSVQEYDKFLWIPMKFKDRWVWLKKVHVVEKYSNMIINGNHVKLKMSTEITIKED